LGFNESPSPSPIVAQNKTTLTMYKNPFSFHTQKNKIKNSNTRAMHTIFNIEPQN
jgi:hypothetical protein